jgi:hypothetical protein
VRAEISVLDPQERGQPDFRQGMRLHTVSGRSRPESGGSTGVRRDCAGSIVPIANSDLSLKIQFM